jgi:hypothetical protein
MASGCSPSFEHLIGKQIKQVQGSSMLKRVYDCDDDFENLPPHDFENELHEFKKLMCNLVWWRMFIN